jgi:hypothetical protein
LDPQSTTAANFDYTLGHVKLDPERIIKEKPAVIMENLMLEHSQMPDDKRILLYTLIRVQHSLAKNDQRKLLVQVRLQALSILAYSEEIEENDLIYRGLIKELVDVLMIDDFLSLPDIKAASMNTLTAIIHLKKTNIIEIIETAQIASYHGLLPKLVRK